MRGVNETNVYTTCNDMVVVLVLDEKVCPINLTLSLLHIETQLVHWLSMYFSRLK